METQHPLFNQPFEWRRMPDSLRRAIEAMPDSVVLADDKSALATLTREHWLRVPQLALPGEDQRVGTSIVRCIEFTGTAALFSAQPSLGLNRRPRGAVLGNKLLLTMGEATAALDSANYFAEQEHLIAECLKRILTDVAEHNAYVDRGACSLFEERRQSLRLARSAPPPTGNTAALGMSPPRRT